MTSRPLLQLLKTPQEYFHQKVTAARSSLSIDLDDQLEFYVVNLLCEFIDLEKMNQSVGKMGPGNALDQPLALILKQAMESPPPSQVRIYKHLGDTSLYVAGFFQEFFNRKTYDVDYYISMGQTAYRSLSSIMRDRMHDEHFMQMYGKLSERFSDLVEIVAEVSDPPESEKPTDILAVYDRWTRSQSVRLRRALEKAGILPIKSSSSDEN